MMRIGEGAHAYEWIDNWATYPDTGDAAEGWVHPGMAFGRDGSIYTSHPGRPEILVYDRAGKLRGSWKADAVEIHNLVLVEENGREYLWVTDNGAKRFKDIGYEYRKDSSGAAGQVLKFDIGGALALRLDMPALPDYAGARWSPTAVAVNQERFGGNGDVWVADGYGKSYVHRYDKAGTYLGSLNGEDGAGRFSCPHGILIDVRKSEPELYVADRANSRVQVYDAAGRFRRVFGQDHLKKPSCFAVAGNDLIVGDLSARLSVFDSADRFVCHLGDNLPVCARPGWPNALDGQGARVRPAVLEAGKFNSPHGLTADPAGNLYIAEWLIGGRMIKLNRLAA